jgi:hypothetical protein
MLKGKEKEITFVCLSLISVSCLFGAFAGDLQGYEVFQQPTKSKWGQPSETFIITEKETDPYGFDSAKSKLIASKYKSDFLQKILLLFGGMVGSSTALMLANIDFDKLEIEYAAKKLQSEGLKQYKLQELKNRIALASLAQKQQFKAELRELVILCGGDETLEADEANATDKFTNALYLSQDGHSDDTVVKLTWGLDPGSDEFNHVKKQFLDFKNGDKVDDA